MKDDRLPKAFLCAQLADRAVKRAQGHEHCLKQAIIDDLKAFGFFGEGVVFTGNAAEDHWTKLIDITKDRNLLWRKAVKTDGVSSCMTAWYAKMVIASNKRHMKSDGDNYVPKEAFVFDHTVKLVELRDKQEGQLRSGCELVVRAPVVLSAARNMLKNL